jgi:hypothetical protein
MAAGAEYPPLRSYAGGEVVWEGRMHEPKKPTPEVPHSNVMMLPQWRTEQIYPVTAAIVSASAAGTSSTSR